MKTATLVKEYKPNSNGASQRLYRLSHPLNKARYVIVSAVIALFSGPETYIFKATRTGRVRDWGELDGSYRGGLDHKQALRNAGYITKGDTK